MDAADLADYISQFLDENDQPYNWVYLRDKAQEIIDDLESGVGTDPYYGD